MRKGKYTTEAIALIYMWPALIFAAIWLWFKPTEEHLVVGRGWVYLCLGVLGLVALLRTQWAIKTPHSVMVDALAAVEVLILTVAVRLTGGIHSDLWLLYYFQTLAVAMDPSPRTTEITAPFVILGYIAASLPYPFHWDWPVIEILGTRLFFLFLTALLIRRVALVRDRMSEEMADMDEQLSLLQERNRISREIHDGVGHSLVNCILTLELCERLVEKDPCEAGKIIKQEKIDLRSAMDEMREYVHHLRPAEVDNEQFVPLVSRYITHFGERTGLITGLNLLNQNIDLPPSSRLVMLRILQEALTNAAKHADATEVEVCLARTGDGGVHCVIADNGCGFDEERVLKDPGSRQGFGLRTMIDRARSCGGDLQVESALNEGTKVSIYIPG